MDQNVFDGCMIAEELAYGCSGIATAIEGTGLGVKNLSKTLFTNRTHADYQTKVQCYLCCFSKPLFA